jgi:hypothetical protein
VATSPWKEGRGGGVEASLRREDAAKGALQLGAGRAVGVGHGGRCVAGELCKAARASYVPLAAIAGADDVARTNTPARFRDGLCVCPASFSPRTPAPPRHSAAKHSRLPPELSISPARRFRTPRFLGDTPAPSPLPQWLAAPPTTFRSRARAEPPSPHLTDLHPSLRRRRARAGLRGAEAEPEAQSPLFPPRRHRSGQRPSPVQKGALPTALRQGPH